MSTPEPELIDTVAALVIGSNGLLGAGRPALERWENEGGATLEQGARRVLPKKLVVFDLDGTIAESKAAIDSEMAGLLGRLLAIARVAIISGGDWPQFQKQVISHLPPTANLKALSLLPTCGTKFYRYNGDWGLLYAEDFGPEGGRVAPGRYRPEAPTDPDVRDSRIRLLETRLCYAGHAWCGDSSG